MRDWELVDSDRFSFDDSDRFEEDSLCSWISEPESLCNNWRGWKKSTLTGTPGTCLTGIASSVATTQLITTGLAAQHGYSSKRSPEFASSSLVELTAKCVASHIPFEMVEHMYPPVPEQLQLRIAFWSFPEHEEDIRLYSCLANGSAEEFLKGDKLFRNDCVSDILQIGFHLSANVKPSLRETHKVAVTFDRRRITTCTCSCNSTTNWCGHVVAVCLHRIYQAKDVTLRAPVSESLSRLHRDQLQKFAQYLISELPQQILPTAQRLLDELLSSQRSAINTLRGAPDPTAGASANEQTTWFLDEKTLHGNIHKILIKFCVPAPIVFSDVNYLSSAAPPASAEWSSLLRPLRGREPEGMWNLLSIVREMFRREDRNAIPLLEVITEECLNCDQILVWWFNTKVALHNGNSGHGGKHHSVNSNAHACQHAGSSLCDEIVILWRLAALNPGISPEERGILLGQFKEWHMKIIEKVSKSRNASVGSKHANSFKNDVEVFPGFRPAVEGCFLSWECYPIFGVTYSESSKAYHCPFMCFRHSDGHSRSGDTGMIHSSHAVLNNPVGEHHLLHSSATISSVPGITKRPRSVDFGGDSQVHVSGSEATTDNNGGSSSNDNVVASGSSTVSKYVVNGAIGGSSTFLESAPGHSAAGLSGAGPVKTSKTSKSRRARNVGGEKHSGISASGLKPKLELNVSSFDSSFDGEIPGTSSGIRTVATEKVEGISEATGLNLSDLAVITPTPQLQRQPAVIVRNGNRSSVSSQSEGFCENELEGLDNECEPDEVPQLPGQIHAGSLNTTTSEDVDGDNDVDGDSDSSIFVPAVVPGVVDIPQPKFDSSDSQQSGDEYQLYYYDPKGTTSKKSGESSSTEDSSSNNASNLPGTSNGGAGTSGGQKKDHLGLSAFSNIKRIEDPWDVLFARAEGLHAHGHSKEACKLGVKLASELLANPPKLTIELPSAPTGKGKRKKVNPISHQVSCLASTTLAKCAFLCTVLAEDSEYSFLAFQVGMFGLELARPPASTKPLEVKLANQEAELAQLLKRIPVGPRELEMMREKAESLKSGTFKSRGEALLPLVHANFIFDLLVTTNNTGKEVKCGVVQSLHHLPLDEAMGFEAAVAALGLKSNVSEADHPLLCEGTRRQRGELALVMLLHYKDDPEKLAKIMDKLLDKEIHQLYKAPLPPAYYSNNPPTAPLLGAVSASTNSVSSSSTRTEEQQQPNLDPSPPPGIVNGCGSNNDANGSLAGAVSSSPPIQQPLAAVGSKVQSGSDLPSNGNPAGNTVNGVEGNSNSSSDSNGEVEAAAGVNGASGTQPPVSQNGVGQGNQNQMTQTATASLPAKSGRYKGKRSYPVLPNQPSEASSHYMFELAKNVLVKAGGSSNQSLFTQPNAGANPRGPHRALHMCAFHMGLYALGLHNAVSPNWLSRTYSSHVSWITGQAMEIGAPAIAFLIDTWDSHLTPTEAVTIADRASRGDANMVRAAAELALSCLPYAHALNPNEIHRAILQCKEQSDGMLEKACLTVESAAKGGGVYPEVLFDVARQWFSLYQKHLPLDMDVFNDDCNHHESLMSLDGSMDHLTTNGRGQLVSPQTGLPPLNPNNPPQPPPSVSSSGSSIGPDLIQVPPPSHQHNGAVYSIATPQVPMPYGQVPYLQANFNAMPGNFIYSQAVIYQANTSNNPATTSSSYYSQQAQAHQTGSVPQYMHPNMHPPFQHPQGHPGLQHMVSTGPPLHFYPAPIPITSSSNNHSLNMRPSNAQFFPVNHGHNVNGMLTAHNQNHHQNAPSNGPQMAVVTASGVQGLNVGNMGMNGHIQPMPPVSHHGPHPVGVGVNPHLVMSNPSQGMHPSVNQQGQNGMMPTGNGPMHCVGPSGIPQAGIPIMNNRGPAQPQMNNGPVVSHNGMYMQGNNMMPPMHPGNMQPMGMPDVPSTSSAQHFLQGGREPINVGQHQNGQSAIKIKYLLAAYRVGMLALEALARRVHDDRPQAKFARNPPYGEDVKWLLSISRKLGAQYLQQFCICAVSSISNPFVLHEIILDASMIPTRNNLTWVYQNPRSPLAPLVQKCQQMYFQCLHQKLYHITISDYEDFVSIVCNAKQAFHLTPDGISQFKEWLTNLRRSKACKKDLWTQITASLQSNPK